MLIKIIWGAIIMAVIAIILADRWYRAKRRRRDQTQDDLNIDNYYGIIADAVLKTGKPHVGTLREDGSFEVREVK